VLKYNVTHSTDGGDCLTLGPDRFIPGTEQAERVLTVSAVTRRAVRVMRKKLKLSFDVGDSGNKKYKRGYGGTYEGVCRSLHLSGVMLLVLSWCVWQNVASVAVRMFSLLIHQKQKKQK
jgi:hypothetical protein